ncbi:hypothetical protein BU23DRAFT_416330, partial [Bimuria novae-zelandiae CBS 107.79]
MHHFATPLRPSQHTSLSLRASQYKRKRVDDSADDHDGLDDDANSGFHSDSQSAPLNLASTDAFQIPASPFPHVSPRVSRGPYYTAANVQQELAGLSPALFAPDTASKHQPVASQHDASALRTKHLHVLNTVMHRCLLEGDYDRASRAWGMILRTQAHGKSIEPRHNGLWGLGAELLLRRKENQENQNSQADDEDVFSDEGFQLARDYYERLILQYPFRVFQPHTVNATTFYPPLFSVWIMQVLERSRRMRRPDIQREELTGAREICQRLDELVQSPPFDKNTQLLILRGHVGYWISDILVGRTATQEQDDDADYGSDGIED